MEWGKCRADTRSSHTQHVRRIALDTEREGRAPWPIRPPADPRLDTDLPAHDLQTMHLAHVHRASRRGRPVERDSTLSLRPRADRRNRRCRRKVEGATPRAHLRTRGSVSAGRWSAVGQKRAPDIVHLHKPQRADLSVEEQPRHPAGPGRRASGAADTVRCPPARLAPRSRPAAHRELSSRPRSATPARHRARRRRPVFGHAPEPAAPVACRAASAPCSLPRPSAPAPAPSRRRRPGCQPSSFGCP